MPTNKEQAVAVKALVLDDENRVLMGRRLSEIDYGLYELPGGTVEDGETIDQTLAREIDEETGAEVELVGWDGEFGYPEYVTHNSWKEAVLMIFRGRLISAENLVSENDELDQIGFYPRERVKELYEQNSIRRAFAPLIERYLKGELDG